MTKYQPPPNPRVQRTRSASLRSPLTRSPLGPAKWRIGSAPLIAMLAVVVEVKCGQQSALRYACAGVEAHDRSYRVTAGDSQVLQLYNFRGVPVPDAFSGYSLYVAIEPSLLKDGAKLAIPSSGVHGYLSTLSGPSYQRTEALAGTLTVDKLKDTSLVGRLDVKAKDVAWQFHGNVEFTSAVATGQPRQ